MVQGVALRSEYFFVILRLNDCHMNSYRKWTGSFIAAWVLTAARPIRPTKHSHCFLATEIPITMLQREVLEIKKDRAPDSAWR